MAELENLISLARLKLSDEEKQKLLLDVSSILQYVDQIKQAEADISSDTVTQTLGLINILRPDNNPHVGGEFTRVLVGAAPDSDGDYFRVKRIL